MRAALGNNVCVVAPIANSLGDLQETAEFRRQAQDYAKLWGRRHGNCEILELPGLNHYETIESLTNPASMLSQRTIGWFGI